MKFDFSQFMECPRCGYRIDASSSVCSECGLPTQNRSPRFDGHHDIRRLSRTLWRLTVSLSIPNLVFATALMTAAPRLWGHVSCGSLSLLGIYNLIAIAVTWGWTDRFKLRATDGTQHHHNRRGDTIRLTGWLCRMYLCLTALACASVMGMRGGV